MPGAFAHLTIVDILAGDENGLDAITTLTPTMKHALGFYTNFCELGAVSPDYPYLTALHPSAMAWANVMHYYQTADFIRRGIHHLCKTFPDLTAPDAEPCLAWLFGYTTHVVADLTVHPVIALKVGAYEQHKTEHRVCELNQDVYIVKTRYHDEIGTPEHSLATGIASCSDQRNPKMLHPSVAALWRQILNDIDLTNVHLKDDLPAPTSPPDPDEWHRWYVEIIATIAQGRLLPPLSRHFAEHEGIAYAPFDEVNRDYIDHLTTPRGDNTTYDPVVDEALKNITASWQELGAALTANDPSRFTLPNGDLDTGRQDTGLQGPPMIFWRT
jgi:hypothetical protein